MRILLIEDERDTAAYIVRGFREHGHITDHLTDGQDGLLQAREGKHDLLVIDRMLPSLDGLSIVKMLRGITVRTPVLLLSNIGGLNDRVEGLNAGADDYLVKPFSFAELLARAHALLRRPALTEVQAVLNVGPIELNRLNRTVTRSGQLVQLQPREFNLLEFFMRHSDQVVTRTMLLESVWDYHFDPKTNIVETHVSRLRSKIGSDLIITVRGSGYMIRAST